MGRLGLGVLSLSQFLFFALESDRTGYTFTTHIHSIVYYYIPRGIVRITLIKEQYGETVRQKQYAINVPRNST